MKNYSPVVFLSLFLLVTYGIAKPKPTTKDFAFSCEKVWPVVKLVVKQHYDVMNLNDQEQAGSFTTGIVWIGMQTRHLSFSLNQKGDVCTIAVKGEFSGITHDDKGDFFIRVRNALAITFPEAKRVEVVDTTQKPKCTLNTASYCQ